jgi:hypothetical protein
MNPRNRIPHHQHHPRHDPPSRPHQPLLCLQELQNIAGTIPRALTGIADQARHSGAAGRTTQAKAGRSHEDMEPARRTVNSLLKCETSRCDPAWSNNSLHAASHTSSRRSNVCQPCSGNHRRTCSWRSCHPRGNRNSTPACRGKRREHRCRLTWPQPSRRPGCRICNPPCNACRPCSGNHHRTCSWRSCHPRGNRSSTPACRGTHRAGMSTTPSRPWRPWRPHRTRHCSIRHRCNHTRPAGRCNSRNRRPRCSIRRRHAAQR